MILGKQQQQNKKKAPYIDYNKNKKYFFKIWKVFLSYICVWDDVHI